MLELIPTLAKFDLGKSTNDIDDMADRAVRQATVMERLEDI